MSGKIKWKTTYADGTVSEVEAEGASINNADIGDLRAFLQAIPQQTSSSEKKSNKIAVIMVSISVGIFIVLGLLYMAFGQKFHDYNSTMVYIFLSLISCFSTCIFAYKLVEQPFITAIIIIASILLIAINTNITNFKDIFNQTQEVVKEKTKNKDN
ncbi:hypothetical protein [Citrobacter braakii]|uniref:hypothetical protein n=1 Tax=Citrobacter braakii TaxID=57706 RepID=UPI002433546C|nr:hypothetical protein [Citrobacter braakii]WFW20355.1 hypothetical protein NFJ63_14000 [Citrobacter braakii]